MADSYDSLMVQELLDLTGRAGDVEVRLQLPPLVLVPAWGEPDVLVACLLETQLSYGLHGGGGEGGGEGGGIGGRVKEMNTHIETLFGSVSKLVLECSVIIAVKKLTSHITNLAYSECISKTKIWTLGACGVCVCVWLIRHHYWSGKRTHKELCSVDKP